MTKQGTKQKSHISEEKPSVSTLDGNKMIVFGYAKDIAPVNSLHPKAGVKQHPSCEKICIQGRPY